MKCHGKRNRYIQGILVVEALSAEFVAKFWEFVKKGNYDQRNNGVNENVEPKHEYFRFMKPANIVSQ